MVGFTNRGDLQPEDLEGRKRPFKVNCRIIERRTKAILIAEIGTATTVWLPRSEITLEETLTSATVTLPTWLAIEKGLNTWGGAPGQGRLF